MKQQRYETLVLMRTGTTEEEFAKLEKGFQDSITAHSGSITSIDRWGKYKLAYPINKESYGLYVLVRYQAPSFELKEIEKKLSLFFKVGLPDVVMRHVNVRLSEDAPTNYIRPSSIEEGGSSSVDSLIKDGILSSSKQSRSSSVVEEEAA